MDAIRLDFNDMGNSVLYLTKENTHVIVNQHSVLGKINDDEAMYFCLNVSSNDLYIDLKYATEIEREIDYKYTIQMLDELYGIDICTVEKPEKEEPRNNHGIERITFGSK